MKPCPFCGGKPYTWASWFSVSGGHPYYKLRGYIDCDDCRIEIRLEKAVVADLDMSRLNRIEKGTALDNYFKQPVENLIRG
jgi:hypothetical protein